MGDEIFKSLLVTSATTSPLNFIKYSVSESSATPSISSSSDQAPTLNVPKLEPNNPITHHNQNRIHFSLSIQNLNDPIPHHNKIFINLTSENGAWLLIIIFFTQNRDSIPGGDCNVLGGRGNKQRHQSTKPLRLIVLGPFLLELTHTFTARTRDG